MAQQPAYPQTASFLIRKATIAGVRVVGVSPTPNANPAIAGLHFHGSVSVITAAVVASGLATCYRSGSTFPFGVGARFCNPCRHAVMDKIGRQRAPPQQLAQPNSFGQTKADRQTVRPSPTDHGDNHQHRVRAACRQHRRGAKRARRDSVSIHPAPAGTERSTREQTHAHSNGKTHTPASSHIA